MYIIWLRTPFNIASCLAVVNLWKLLFNDWQSSSWFLVDRLSFRDIFLTLHFHVAVSWFYLRYLRILYKEYLWIHLYIKRSSECTKVCRRWNFVLKSIVVIFLSLIELKENHTDNKIFIHIWIYTYKCTHVVGFIYSLGKPCVLRHCVGFAIPSTHSALGAMFNYHMHGEDN